jgi:hypothetical protein
MNIAFLYIAEAYQCYHGAAIGLELAKRPGWRVVNYHNDDETPRHLARIAAAYGAEDPECRRLRRAPATRGMQSIRILGMFKSMVLWDNRAELASYDAVFAVEDSAAFLRRIAPRPMTLIYGPHGFGDRAAGFARLAAAFDLVLLAGSKTACRMLHEGLVRPGGYATIGPVKLETAEKLRRQHGPLFAEARPIVLYNPHKAPGLSSWPHFIRPMLDAFGRQQEFNLVVAPHIKMFRRRSARMRARWDGRSSRTILVDTASDRLLDMTYTVAADVYVGDVSSQVYEFLAVPRPCVFLNPNRLRWRNDPNFAHWHLGDVIERPDQLMDAIRAAPSRHHRYRARQEEMAQASLGDRAPGAAERGADAIAAYLARPAAAQPRPGWLRHR